MHMYGLLGNRGFTQESPDGIIVLEPFRLGLRAEQVKIAFLDPSVPIPYETPSTVTSRLRDIPFIG